MPASGSMTEGDEPRRGKEALPKGFHRIDGDLEEIFPNVKRAIPTLSLAVFAAGALFFAVAPPDRSDAAASPTPSPKTTKKDVCGATKSKWAHLQCEEFNSSAPGDEYFGRMKMSYLGIDNTYKDGAISAGAYTIDPRLIAKLDFATEALRRWAAKYPNDPQLARSYFLGVQVLRKVYTQPEQQTTWVFIQLLVTKYGNTYFGKVMKGSLAQGFTEHWFALAQICPTPLPPGVMPSEEPEASPTPSPAPGHPAIDVITPPCVQPSTAPDLGVPGTTTLPEPSGSPAALPEPSESPAALPEPSESPAALATKL
jgi:hypothetical protein